MEVEVVDLVEATYEAPKQAEVLPALPKPPKSKDPTMPADSFIMAAALQMMMAQTPDRRVRARCNELIKYFRGPA